jgi:pimeloyl-ACP methyl ester carboxylesterase
VIRRGYADTALGQLHWAEAGEGPTVLCLHQTPRSTDEYAEVLPALASRGLRGIAMDTVGFGASTGVGRPPVDHSIERYADGVVALLEARQLTDVTLLGHHTGGVVAVEVAARRPARLSRLVLSSTPCTDAAFREKRRGMPGIDHVEVRPDGSHLTELWQRRAAFYPAGRPDLLTRFVRDALTVADSLEAGHRAVGAYRMEERLGLVEVPVLLIGASSDPYAYPHLPELSRHLPDAAVVVVEGGMVPLMEPHADEIAAAVRGFVP